MKRFAGAALMVIAAFALGACGGNDPTPPDDDGDDVPESRSYMVGFAPGAPRAETELFLALMDSMAQVSDVTIIQQAVPWAQLLAGSSIDDLVDERLQLAQFLRAKGLDLIFLVDPLDGLDRRKEDPELVALGRSILEPEIRAMHEDWVLRITSAIRPRWLGLASEINTLAARGDPALYAEIRDLVNALAPAVRQRSPGTAVFVSFQADEANGTLVDPIIDHFALIEDFDIDALGLSSYPVFAFDQPSDIPDGYYSTFDDATDLPLLMVEGGWTSAPVPLGDGTPQEQVDFLRRTESLLDEIEAEAWVMLTFTDLDIEALGLPPERAAGLSNFSRMGILDIHLDRKPAFAEWERIFQRPLRP